MRDRKTFHDRSLSENCATLVKHLMDEAVHILSFADFQERFLNVGLGFLTYHGLVSSVMTCQKKRFIFIFNYLIFLVGTLLSLLTQTQNRGQLFSNGERSVLNSKLI